MRSKILVADDNKQTVKDLIDLLRSNNNEVIFCKDSTEVIEKIKEHNDIKLFILDLYMPGIDGLALSEKIRKIDRYKDIKIFIHTSEKSPMAKELSKNYKIDGWIVKPCNPKNILDIINKMKMTA
ncbi:MAG: response regulator [Oligoflexia bacterium]|nr:response regulator [Oligoflexia bacterium]